MRQLYWCDKCYKENIDENEITKRIYFSCYSNQQWASHLKSKKHLKICKQVVIKFYVSFAIRVLLKKGMKSIVKEIINYGN